ncbi:YfmQ family protein [Alicyclobacillus ferrooxydans]|uniref:Uncharacterized protein n=1 Tax=Alicyclobacillus ferrooxydans TaxID=471514 RepID=A0A0P9D1M0_9BACL|nr:YfmQ family protein [Alicyclobacillus ferrooxydans]KPV43412.1 hypothetical protein AN477_12480 [Alicyclobacillus ferrooxydans]
MLPTWYIPVFIALVLLSFFMTPPTFIVKRVMSRFQLHPTLTDKDTIFMTHEAGFSHDSEVRTVHEAELTGKDKEDFIRHWNAAKFLYQHKQGYLDREGRTYTVRVSQRGIDQRFVLIPRDLNIDVIKHQPRKGKVAYQVYSPELLELAMELANRGSSPAQAESSM